MNWSYAGDTRPDCWGKLSREFRLCADGHQQSPIAISSSDLQPAALPAPKVDYGPLDLQIEDSGFGFIASPTASSASPSCLVFGKRTYRLIQFHAHSPAEHVVDGRQYPLELHFVHEDTEGSLAVAGVLCRQGDEAAAYAPLVGALANALDAERGRIRPTSLRLIDSARLLPERRECFVYDGSLTTPPCSEGVRWLLLREPLTLGASQIDLLGRQRAPTNRPTQPLNGRIVELAIP